MLLEGLPKDRRLILESFCSFLRRVDEDQFSIMGLKILVLKGSPCTSSGRLFVACNFQVDDFLVLLQVFACLLTLI